MKRVVVTGMGAVTPIGNNVEEFWDGIKKNKVGIGEITKFDVSEYKCKMGAEVKDFDPKQYMDPKAARRMEPFCQYAVAATGEAIKNAGIDLEKEDLTRFGTCIGNGLGGVATIEKEHAKVMNGKANRVSVMMVPSRKCSDRIWLKGQMYRCCNSMCDRNKQHWRGISLYSGRRCRCDGSRRR